MTSYPDMPDSDTAARIAQATAFATLGVLSTTQDVAGVVLSSVEDAEGEVVVEETLCLVATATARAAEVGFRGAPAVQAAVVPALLELPFTYRDYLVGGALLIDGEAALADASERVYRRLQRKREFYAVHLPENAFPGERALRDKMALWMGRVSPPGLPEMPEERLEKLDLVTTVATHTKLVLAYARQEKSA